MVIRDQGYFPIITNLILKVGEGLISIACIRGVNIRNILGFGLSCFGGHHAAVYSNEWRLPQGEREATKERIKKLSPKVIA